ncbi:MAG: GIY-YIG nuclease family protein [bacterium]|nr:GIY-YIG nuclease family protein [bacterium]
MPYYVYILKSLKNNDLYVGSTENVEQRLFLKGSVKSTKGYRPWVLLECYTYYTRSDAVKQERHFKQHQQKELLRAKHKAE